MFCRRHLRHLLADDRSRAYGAAALARQLRQASRDVAALSERSGRHHANPAALPWSGCAICEAERPVEQHTIEAVAFAPTFDPPTPSLMGLSLCATHTPAVVAEMCGRLGPERGSLGPIRLVLHSHLRALGHLAEGEPRGPVVEILARADTVTPKAAGLAWSVSPSTRDRTAQASPCPACTAYGDAETGVLAKLVDAERVSRPVEEIAETVAALCDRHTETWLSRTGDSSRWVCRDVGRIRWTQLNDLLGPDGPGDALDAQTVRSFLDAQAAAATCPACERAEQAEQIALADLLRPPVSGLDAPALVCARHATTHSRSAVSAVVQELDQAAAAADAAASRWSRRAGDTRAGDACLQAATALDGLLGLALMRDCARTGSPAAEVSEEATDVPG